MDAGGYDAAVELFRCGSLGRPVGVCHRMAVHRQHDAASSSPNSHFSWRL